MLEFGKGVNYQNSEVSKRAVRHKPQRFRELRDKSACAFNIHDFKLLREIPTQNSFR